MRHISVIIIAKNEAENIVACIKSARLISDDVIVADSGSDDGTTSLIVDAGAKLLPVEWKGYGQTRNEAAGIAANDWILALDADERITPALSTAVNNLSFTDSKLLYGFKRENFLAEKKIRFGEWGRDTVYRLYNKQAAWWDDMLVHEHIIGNGIHKKILPGSLLHYTMKDMEEYQKKTDLYARLSADKYALQGKKALLIKRFIAPVFSFVQNYIFRLGFLDGRNGLLIAYSTSHYVFLKYKFLKQLNQQQVMFIE